MSCFYLLSWTFFSVWEACNTVEFMVAILNAALLVHSSVLLSLLRHRASQFRSFIGCRYVIGTYLVHQRCIFFLLVFIFALWRDIFVLFPVVIRLMLLFLTASVMTVLIAFVFSPIIRKLNYMSPN